MISATTRLTIGTLVGFISGMGLLGVSSTDNQYLTSNIDSVIGGALALISLIGFIQHHMEQAKTEKPASTNTVAVVETPAQ